MAIKKGGNEVSEYEQARQEKIAKNQQLLQQLQLDAQQTGIGAKSRSKPPPTAGQKRKRAADRVKKEEADAGPRRTSARLQGIVADSEVARQKNEADAEASREQERVRRQRVSDDINLVDAVVSGRTWNKAGNWLSAVGPANPGERTFSISARDNDDGEDSTHAPADEELQEVRERMSRMQLWEGAEPNRIKITPERIYSLAFHPTPDKAVVFAGDKLGNLGLFDASQTSPETVKHEADDADEDGDVGDDLDPAISTFKLHTRTISAFHFAPHDPNALYTASYDSSIRHLDLTAGQATEAYAPADRGADAAISGVEISPTDPHLLHFTTLDGAFGLHDLRTPAHETTHHLQLSEKKIGGFTLHPLQPHLLATASLDRTLKVWDLRTLTTSRSKKTASPTLLGEHTSKLSVSHAAFNSAGQIATTSYDDTIKIHTVPPTNPTTTTTTSSDDENPPDLPPQTLIPHNNQTGRWVTILRAQWQAHPPTPKLQRFVIGNMNRFVDVYTADGRQLAQLGGEGVTAVPAVARMHDSQEWVAGGTASGKCCLWM
ncbi:hypothetical protein B0A50_07471 [Salinomyces thailandicus]|uniref:DNA damage-binding protein CMR1 n=1 Tax=Salinomyces thailandicus TaxID=706561 RepID=A0A4U0TNX3_9PEZI|nr:hypothetical protein B0A50_07471 [Salinomyces thailandica]